MSSKLLKQFIQQASALDEITDSKGSTPKVSQKASKLKSRNELAEEPKKSALQSQLESMLFFDKAFSDRSGSTNKSLKRRQENLDKKTSKKKDPTGNSRSSSSISARKAHVPTFNKKTHEAQKKVKDMKQLAKMLRNDK